MKSLLLFKKEGCRLLVIKETATSITLASAQLFISDLFCLLYVNMPVSMLISVVLYIDIKRLQGFNIARV
jgi:hypothetical protein